jgi:putative membrane protein
MIYLLKKQQPGRIGPRSDHTGKANHFSTIQRSTSMKWLHGFYAAVLSLLAFSASAQAPNDAQIAAIVVTANQVDIDAGKLALTKSAAKDVKDFAQLMVTDHSGVNKAATELVTKLKVKPEENSTSTALKKGGEDTLERLKRLKGAQFDKAYVDNEVTYHQTVLDAIDKTLIPSAKNEELKSLLVKVRPAFAAHLEHAKHLQSSLKK